MQKENTLFDYIIIGAGAAGLMLAEAMGRDVFFRDKSILVLDKDAKKINDRTWCFWEKGPGHFDDIVHQTWDHIYFSGQRFSERFPIAPYSYKMIKGIDFYTSYFSRISSFPNIIFSQEKVSKIQEGKDVVRVITEKKEYRGKQVFNSIFDYRMATGQKKYPVLQQHFLGWFLRTTRPIFDVNQATYMDFSVPQQGNTRFIYVLPFSETEALVEYTLFSEDLLPEEDYKDALVDYLKSKLKSPDFEIMETEKGNIPMTCYNFSEHNTSKIYHIGTAGGWAKPSTGYTFMSTSKKVPILLEFLKTGKPLNTFRFKNRFWYYDLLFLDVLKDNNAIGFKVFEALFKNRTPQQVFKFLDEETNIWEDLGNIWGSPKIPFTKALLKRLF
ncbi:lycopene cyclase family protein [Ulvibacterium sp.]|uniref:lycopene cyclase family protein n=1 Tax=Ulvibacterium sp. TaxID=2665914 RepID=UPI00260A5D7B|nr:lycopene cyclase family protein [Ulvibacterium sp.]